MEALLPIFGVAAGVVGLIAYPPYIRDMFRGTTRPHRASWLIWTVLSGIALAGQIGAGASWSLLMTIAQTLGTATIFLLSLRLGIGGLQKRDIASLVVAALGLLLWAITDQPLLAILLVVLVDAAGAWLTTAKAYKDPGSETLVTWLLDSISNMLGVLAVGSLNVTLLLYPSYLLLANLSVVVAIYMARYTKRGTLKGGNYGRQRQS